MTQILEKKPDRLLGKMSLEIKQVREMDGQRFIELHAVANGEHYYARKLLTQDDLQSSFRRQALICIDEIEHMINDGNPDTVETEWREKK